MRIEKYRDGAMNTAEGGKHYPRNTAGIRRPPNGRKVSCSSGDNDGILVKEMGTELSESWMR